jgi:hypothetical protein
MPSPQTGHLTTVPELEALGLSLQDWLNATRNLSKDAWAEGNTNCAFSVNNITGVERSHRSNDWNYFGVDLAKGGHATYTYMLKEPVMTQLLSDETTEVPGLTQVWDNTLGKTPLDFTNSYTQSEEKSTSLTVSTASSLSITTGMDIEGFSFSVTASFDKSRTEENSKTQSSSTTDTVTATLAPGQKSGFQTFTSTRARVMIYEVTFAIGSDNPEGSIAKAPDNQSSWTKFFRVEDVIGDRANSTASYTVETKDVTTTIRVIDPNAQKLAVAVGHATPLDLHIGPPPK